MTESVKGTLVLGAVVAARRLRDRGRVEPEVLEVRLSREALELLDQKIEVARWYPIAPFCELIDFGWEIDGRREVAYLERGGAESANRLFESNRYQQLEFVQRAGKVASRHELTKRARLITTIVGTFYDFLDVHVALEADALVIVYGNARAFSNALIHTTVGFQNQINVRLGSKLRWSGVRTRPDEVRFAMPIPKRLEE